MMSRNSLALKYQELTEGHVSGLVEPFIVFDGYEVPVTQEAANRAISNFEETGIYTQAGTSSTLWVLIAHCTVNHIPFEICGISGSSLYIKIKDIPL